MLPSPLPAGRHSTTLAYGVKPARLPRCSALSVLSGAIVLPNGPEMASVFLCVAAAATTAPLNLAYRESEFEFYLSDLKAKALIVEHGSSSPAVAVAKAQGLRIV